MKEHTIKLSTCEVKIDEHASESDIRRYVPNFFRPSRGRRETFTMHRGFIISRETVTFTGSKPQRKTTVYLYTRDLEGSPNTFCVSMGYNLTSIRQAKRHIDRIIETGVYERGAD